MNAIKATVMQGRLELKVPLDWADGTEVLIEPTIAPVETIGIDESEWRDDPESLADWDAWIKSIEPFELTPDEAKWTADFAEQMRQYNLVLRAEEWRRSSLWRRYRGTAEERSLLAAWPIERPPDWVERVN